MISRYKHICRKILQTYNLSTLCHKKLEKLTTTVTKKDTESVIKSFPTKKSKDQICSQINSTKYIEKLLGICKKYLQKMFIVLVIRVKNSRGGKMLPNSVYEAPISLKAKSNKKTAE